MDCDVGGDVGDDEYAVDRVQPERYQRRRHDLFQQHYYHHNDHNDYHYDNEHDVRIVYDG